MARGMELSLDMITFFPKWQLSLHTLSWTVHVIPYSNELNQL
jgi:hypothetical protein